MNPVIICSESLIHIVTTNAGSQPLRFDSVKCGHYLHGRRSTLPSEINRRDRQLVAKCRRAVVGAVGSGTMRFVCTGYETIYKLSDTKTSPIEDESNLKTRANIILKLRKRRAYRPRRVVVECGVVAGAYRHLIITDTESQAKMNLAEDRMQLRRYSVGFWSPYVARKTARYQIWDVKCLKEGQRIFLKSLDTKGAINIRNETSSSMDIAVEGNRVMQVQKLLRDREIPFVVTVTDMAGLNRPRSPISLGSARPRSPLKRPLDWHDFYPLHTINNFMDSLETLYPSTCTVSVIGHTVEGRGIKMLKISNSDARNTGVWLDGTIHAREWISASVVTFIADYIARNFDKLPTSITNKDWYFVPVVNPDGYNYSHTTDRLWRKNRARVGNVVCGVDLNRNFGHNWGRTGVEFSSVDPNHNNYRGSEPFSEPESAAVKDLILYSGIPFKIFLTFHAYSEVISFPWCFTAVPCDDYVELLEGGTTMAKAIYETTGRMYKVGNFKDLMYYACGTSIDWSYGTARIPYTYLIELRSKEHKFLLPREQILDCCKEVLNGVKALAEYVDKKKCSNCTVLAKKLR